MSESKTYSGRCFCGAVELAVTGEPAGMHLVAGADGQGDQGAEHLAVFNETDRSSRKWCTECGGHVLTDHPHWKLVDVYAATIPEFPFKAGVHVHYQETVLHLRDGLPKMKDLPKDMGGSGETLPE